MRMLRLARERAGVIEPRDTRSRFGPLRKAAHPGSPQRPMPQPFADADGDNDRVITPILFPHQRISETPEERRRA